MATALTFSMCLIAVLHSSCSVPHLFPSFFFMAECTWCCLDVAWVSIDFFSLCCVSRCLMQEFRRTHSFAGAHCSFFVSSTSPSLFIPHKKKTAHQCMTLTWKPLYVGVAVSNSKVLHSFESEQQDGRQSCLNLFKLWGKYLRDGFLRTQETRVYAPWKCGY